MERVDDRMEAVLRADKHDTYAEAVHGGRLRLAVSSAYGAGSVTLVSGRTWLEAAVGAHIVHDLSLRGGCEVQASTVENLPTVRSTRPHGRRSSSSSKCFGRRTGNKVGVSILLPLGYKLRPEA